MKVLLLGEYSGLHKYLKRGVQHYGHQCIIASHGDGWKKIHGDISFTSRHTGIIGKIDNHIIPLRYLKQLSEHDIIQFIEAEVFDPKLGYNRALINYLIRHNKKSVLMSAGCSPKFWENIKFSGLTDHPCESCMKYDLRKLCPLSSKKKLRWNNEMAKKVDAIIPFLYSYEYIYSGHKNLKPCIPLPIDLSEITYKPNTVGNRVSFLHGINRPGFKGSAIILKALEEMKRMYPNEISIKIVKHLSLQAYLKVLTDTNVLIDQTYGYGLGLNSLQTMAFGKVLFTNYDARLYPDDLPVIQIKPYVSNIKKKISYIIENRNQIESIGLRSRQYVEVHHDCRNIAAQYIRIWSKL
jgi:glycosyltransferase involved in cell wall biosynthesis